MTLSMYIYFMHIHLFIYLLGKKAACWDIKHIKIDEQQKLIKCIIKRKLLCLRLDLPVQHETFWNDPLKYYAFNFQLRFHLHL